MGNDFILIYGRLEHMVTQHFRGIALPSLLRFLSQATFSTKNNILFSLY
jgi:hypothetical protein